MKNLESLVMMKGKIQIFIIHGGMVSKNRKDYLRFLRTRKIYLKRRVEWQNDYLDRKMGRNFEIIRPQMPSNDNARYGDWKIHFEKHFSFLKNRLVLIGISLGGIFLAKYLSENKFPKKILSTYLICPPFDETLPGRGSAGGFKLRRKLSLLEKNSPRLVLLFSKDDDIVPVADAKKYGERLEKAKIIIYKSKNGHFRISSFPELVKMIKNDAEKR